MKKNPEKQSSWKKGFVLVVSISFSYYPKRRDVSHAFCSILLFVRATAVYKANACWQWKEIKKQLAI